MNKQILSMLDGMSQRERLIPSLNPDNIHISEKDLPDLLRYITNISEHFNYYNTSDQPEGSWAAFFKSDLHVLSILISKFDLPAHINHFFKLEMQLQRSINDAEMVEITAEIFAFIFDLSLQLYEILNNLKNAQFADLFPADREIEDNLKDELLKLFHYNQEAHAAFGYWFISEHKFQNLGIRDRGEKIALLLKGSKGTRKQTLILFQYLKTQFDSLSSKFNTLYSASVFFLNKSNPDSIQYPPHIAMMMAFIELYSLLKSPLNRQTRNHLDLYYKQILGLEYRKAEPDSIHLVFQAVPRVQQVTLLRGEGITGTLVQSKEQLTYALNEDITVTHAQINEIKTIYVSESRANDTEELALNGSKEFRIYKADNSNNHTKRWAVMGEDPTNKTKNELAMEAAELGILIASPILYQPYGRREIELQIYFDSQSFDRLVGYFKDPNKPTEYNPDLAYRFLANAFIIHLTGASGWFTPQKNKVSLDGMEKCIRITIYLEANDEELAVYNPLVHGKDNQVKWPAAKLMINNNAGRNALTFLRKMAMTRITVNAKGRGNHVLNLQNTNGQLSTSSPFQPFGPLAPVGSYLEIRNTNIFNRYTQKVSINLEWEGLPQVPGGWATYYRAYETNIKNSSFKVRLSTETNKRIKSADSEEFNLFEMEQNSRGEEVLADRTFFKDINVKKWELTNNLLFGKDTLLADKTVPDGVIRMELVSPSDGFGHHTFSNIFPQAALANSKWYSPKKELPQQPFIPVLRTITVDYELEETIILNNPPELDPSDLSLKLIHLYPFGYKEIYPLNINFEYLFFPDFNYEQNLFIGLTGILPAQELSILFELEEDSLSDAAKSSEPVKWSSLYNNEWFVMDDSYILNDSTNNFMNTGIVKILIPEQINTGNTIMSSALYWLKAFKPSSREQGIKVTGIHLHAASATRVMSSDSTISTLIIDKGVITQMSKPRKEIQSVKQPSASFGGKLAETDLTFYTRVNERLRHKQRLANPIDIEQIILQEFPQLEMVKCFRAAEGEVAEFAEEVDLRIIVVSSDKQKLQTSEQPKVSLSLLCDIKDFLDTAISPFIKVSVENPVYERIKVVCRLQFVQTRSSDIGQYKRKLQEDIKKYLCPWIYDSEHEFRVGNGLYISDMLNHLKKLDYVSRIIEFSVVHFYNYTHPETGELLTGMKEFATGESNFVIGSLPGAVLIPASQHFIEVVSTAGENIRNELPLSRRVGVKKLVIGEDLLILDGNADEGELTDNETINTGPLFNWSIPHKLINNHERPETQSD